MRKRLLTYITIRRMIYKKNYRTIIPRLNITKYYFKKRKLKYNSREFYYKEYTKFKRILKKTFFVKKANRNHKLKRKQTIFDESKQADKTYISNLKIYKFDALKKKRLNFHHAKNEGLTGNVDVVHKPTLELLLRIVDFLVKPMLKSPKSSYKKKR